MAEYLFFGGSLDGQVRQVDGGEFCVDLLGSGFNRETYIRRGFEVTPFRTHYVFALKGLDIDCVIDMLFTRYRAFTEINDELFKHRRKNLAPLPPDVLEQLVACADGISVDDVAAIFSDNDKSGICVGDYVRVVAHGLAVRGRVCRTTHQNGRTVSVAVDAPGISQSENFAISNVMLDD